MQTPASRGAKMVTPPRWGRFGSFSEMKFYGGGLGIRTPDAREGMPVFKTGAINHSANPPRGVGGEGGI